MVNGVIANNIDSTLRVIF